MNDIGLIAAIGECNNKADLGREIVIIDEQRICKDDEF